MEISQGITTPIFVKTHYPYHPRTKWVTDWEHVIMVIKLNRHLLENFDGFRRFKWEKDDTVLKFYAFSKSWKEFPE